MKEETLELRIGCTKEDHQQVAYMLDTLLDKNVELFCHYMDDVVNYPDFKYYNKYKKIREELKENPNKF